MAYLAASRLILASEDKSCSTNPIPSPVSYVFILLIYALLHVFLLELSHSVHRRAGDRITARPLAVFNLAGAGATVECHFPTLAGAP